jgi:hypothetical protein
MNRVDVVPWSMAPTNSATGASLDCDATDVTWGRASGHPEESPAILQAPMAVAAGLVTALGLLRADGRGEPINLIAPRTGQ